MTTKLYGAIDAGGTTFKCLLATADRQIVAEQRVPTTDPARTLSACVNFFGDAIGDGTLAAIGIASFGPVDIAPTSSAYGTILDTPKAGWAMTNLRAPFEERFGVPVAVETDVNGALLAEAMWGAAQGAMNSAYITVGTGIGGGFLASGKLIGAPGHPEIGHICVSLHPHDINDSGDCPFHGTCLEGMAAAGPIWRRFGDPSVLGRGDLGTDVTGHYLGQLCVAVATFIRPTVIILGGGIPQNPAILQATRASFTRLMGGYLADLPAAERLIVSPELGGRAGAWGGFYLAARAGGIVA